jgi:hypothetical protein
MDVLIALLKPKQDAGRLSAQQEESGEALSGYQSPFSEASSAAAAELDSSIKQAAVQVRHPFAYLCKSVLMQQESSGCSHAQVLGYLGTCRLWLHKPRYPHEVDDEISPVCAGGSGQAA